MRRPDLFIVGAPRCGTTSLYRYLQQHPDVFMCPEKSPNYWSRDLYPPEHLRTEPEYLGLFAAAREQPRVGEASVSYLFSRTAAGAIRAFAPSARIVVMLRDPVEMMHSLHRRRVELGQERILDFEQALAAEEGRRAGRIPGGGGLALYRGVASYTDQLRRYLDAFGPERVKVILYDDLRRDAAAVWRDTLRFLEVREDVPVDLTPVNRGRKIRSAALHRFSNRLARSRLGSRIAHALTQLNSEEAGPDHLPVELRDRLAAELAPEVERLGALLGRDLSAWSRPTA